VSTAAGSESAQGGDRDPSIADALLDAAAAVVAVTVLSRFFFEHIVSS
jgi:hypothetical protein